MKSKYLILIFIFLVFDRIHLFALIDLEENVQDFVLETKQIIISEHLDAFNPGIIRWNGTLLMSFREIPNPRLTFNSDLYLVWLDEDFNPMGVPQKLDNRDFSGVPSRAEDARLIEVEGHLFIVYSDNCDDKVTKGGFRVYIAELVFENDKFLMQNIECLSRFEGESNLLREKNWSPFNYKGTLLLEYSLKPHRIFHPILGTGECETVAVSNSDIRWEWGELRGGTPGLIDGNQYLSFFHSSIDMPTIHSEGKVISHYFMGAYAFSLDPPFKITKVSPEPIMGKNFYNGAVPKPYWKPLRVVFPGGFVFDDQFIWVVYGRQDRELWVVKLDKAGLLNSLVPVE